jgi:four helix bundle suffix protein
VSNENLGKNRLPCSLLDRQMAAQATAFEKEGGFTKQLYRTRSQARRKL